MIKHKARLINGVFWTFEDKEQKKKIFFFFEIGSLYEVLAVLKHYVDQTELKLKVICPPLPCDC